ncbi:MAG TPA: protein-disulfide reductase DsbD domain-containing protein [Hyphomicrobiaceae bacterium]|nr:protein-disulfide reductase DsbD domain-containing protein [Hyphomicrobiaceae bacterium]
MTDARRNMAYPHRTPGWLLLGALLSLAQPAAASGLATPWQHGHGSSARLLVGSSPEADGSVRLLAGVEIRLADGWKTYWRQPGDSGGIPPRFDWTGSVNLSGARVLYPAPERLSDPTGESIGYKKSVIFPVELTPANPTQPMHLKLAFEYGICREICVPAEARFEVTIAPGAVTGLQAELARMIARVPRAASAFGAGAPALVAARAVLTGSAPKLTFEVAVPGGTAGADLFVEAPDGLYLPMAAKVGEAAPDRALFSIDLSRGAEIDRLKGVTLRLTIVGAGGMVETTWKVE